MEVEYQEMRGVVEAMLILAERASPHYYERTCRSGVTLGDYFESRLRALTLFLGEPAVEDDPGWYANAERVACWRRDNKTLTLVLERDARSGAAVLLWCVSDGALATLAEAARTRSARVTAPDFDQFFDRQMVRLAEPGFDRPLSFKMLVDDLAVIPDRAESLLAGKLQDMDGEVRCTAADVVLDLGSRLPAVLPLLEDREHSVRRHVIHLLASCGDDSVVEPLIARLRSDPDPSVRGEAAYALGHIGCPAAIPHLLNALDHDHENDPLGHSPSSISATALDDILETNEMPFQPDAESDHDPPWPSDYEALKTQATELYRKWKAGQDGS